MKKEKILNAANIRQSSNYTGIGKGKRITGENRITGSRNKEIRSLI